MNPSRIFIQRPIATSLFMAAILLAKDSTLATSSRS